ncbi:hypothetical protein N7444_005620 [Penicillium canescens]|nr:hypothetical protein N7444_005620 [Penicillium canescens]
MCQLIHDDLDDSPDQETPIIRAAAKPDSARLEVPLARHAASSAEEDVPQWKRRRLQYLGPSGVMPVPSFLSPIVSATNAQLPHNVHLLLAAGAESNGLRGV